ncbi:unnamed protein product [Lactuca saligna]|uniref:Uncharacterized protein n=1 Tax=Lactuca saligna TaxID=75948 RepID=A0AA35XZZ8_LACSI|nr:unnamed protein product [Lactuca saligna]
MMAAGVYKTLQQSPSPHLSNLPADVKTETGEAKSLDVVCRGGRTTVASRISTVEVLLSSSMSFSAATSLEIDVVVAPLPEPIRTVGLAAKTDDRAVNVVARFQPYGCRFGLPPAVIAKSPPLPPLCDSAAANRRQEGGCAVVPSRVCECYICDV